MPGTPRRPPFLTPLGLALILASVLVPAGFYALAVGASRAASEALLRQHVERTADTMREHAVKVFETQELALDRVADLLVKREEGSIYGPELGAVLEEIAGKLEHTVSMWVTDADGRVIAGSQPWDRSQTIEGRPFWRRLRDGEAGFVIGEPFVGRATGIAVFPLARQRPSEDGSFRGTIHTSLSPDYFARVFERFAPTGRHHAALTRDDGVVLAENGSPVVATDRARFSAMREVTGYPVHVRFSVPEAELRARWREASVNYGLASVAGFFVLAGAATLALRQSRARQLAVVALEAEIAARERSERRLREAARLEGIGRITGGVAHDFNNLLGTVLICLDEIGERIPGDAELAASVATARDAARAGAGLVAGLLAYARGQELVPLPLDAPALVEGMLPLLQNAAGPNVVVTRRRRDPVPACIADPVQLRAALLNVAINARDAMPSGGRLTLDIGPAMLSAADLADNTDAAPGFFVSIAIADTGAGMPREVQARVVAPFFTTKPPGKGTGLGLAQVFGFVRQSAGHVRIDSVEGAGTTVSLYLPATDRPAVSPGEPAPARRQPVATPAPSRPARLAEVPRALPPAVAPVARRRILVADDNTALLGLTCRILAGAGHEAVAVASGDEAAALLEAGERFDLVVTDVVMPGEHDGFAVARRAAAADPPVPVVLVSGYVPEQAGQDAAVAAVVSKPFSRDGLLDAVSAALGEARKPHQGEAARAR